jgi:dephospho-CoA kinase
VNYLVGLTGGIGSGKSTVADMLAAQGARVIDTDLISHQLTQTNGESIPTIREAFGAHFIDAKGALDRNKMRELVFGNPAEKKRLESILHPLIFARAKQQAALITDAPYTLVVVPLLFESGRYVGWLNYVVAVDCPEEAQIARTLQRSKLDRAGIIAIMAQQFGRSERLQQAHEIIHNDGDLDDLRNQVARLHTRLCSMAAESH